MLTGCLFTAPAVGRIAISRWVPRHLRGMPTYAALAPPRWMNNFATPEKFASCYRQRVLAELDAARVWAELHDLALQHYGAGFQPILCCWERLDGTKPGEYCHRTQVAEWFNAALDPEAPVREAAQLRQLDLFRAA
jgi:hypothetical protein